MTEQQQTQLVTTLQLGCPLETALDFAGVLPHEFEAALLADVPFARQVMRARATPEIRHMESVRKAAADEKNWRASVWWLERCLPNRYARRPPAMVPEAEFEAFVAELIELVDTQVKDPQDHARLVANIRALESRKRIAAVDSEPESENEL